MAMVQPEMLVADWTRIPNSCPWSARTPPPGHPATQMCHTTGPAVSPEPHCPTSAPHYFLHKYHTLMPSTDTLLKLSTVASHYVPRKYKTLCTTEKCSTTPQVMGRVVLPSCRRATLIEPRALSPPLLLLLPPILKLVQVVSFSSSLLQFPWKVWPNLHPSTEVRFDWWEVDSDMWSHSTNNQGRDWFRHLIKVYSQDLCSSETIVPTKPETWNTQAENRVK